MDLWNSRDVKWLRNRNYQDLCLHNSLSYGLPIYNIIYFRKTVDRTVEKNF